MNKLYWLSWVQPTDDHRPLTYPPNENVLAWWCSGTCDTGAIICSLVIALDKDNAFNIIKKDWPEIEEFRFIDETYNTTVSSRFPFSDWMITRINQYNQQKSKV